MKKHFLLLLMAFFSLAGWGQTVNSEDVIVNFGPAKYGGGAPAFEVNYQGIRRNVNTAQGKEFDWDNKYYTDEACQTAATLPLAVSAEDSYYYVKLTGTPGTIFDGAVVYGKFQVEKATLTITAIDGITKTYDGQPLNTTIDAVTKITFSGWVGAEATTLQDQTKTAADVLTISPNGISFVYGDAVNAGKYPVTEVIGISNSNYTLAYGADLKAIINPVVIPAGATIAIAGASEADAKNIFTYDATKHAPDYTVTWGEGNAAVTLESTDFRVEFYKGGQLVSETIEVEGGDDIINPVKPTDAAGTVTTQNNKEVVDEVGYTAKLFGVGNYTTADLNEDDNQDGIAIANGGFVIKKAELTVVAIAPQPKVYDGVAFDIANAKDFSITGLANNETVTDLVAAKVTNTDDLKSAGSYQITVNTNNAKINGVAPTNYTFKAIPSTWVINKRPVTLTVGEEGVVTMTKGTDLATFEAGLAYASANVQKGWDEDADHNTIVLNTGVGAISAADQATIAEAYGLELADGEGEILNGVTAATIEIKTYPGAIKPVAPQNANAIANYEITASNGDLKVQGAGFYVMPVVPNQIEYGDEYTIGYNAYTLNGNNYATATIDESKLVFVIGGVEYPYAKAIEGLPTAIAQYAVAIKEGSAVGTGSNEQGTPTLQPSTFSIVKKTLNVTVGNLTVHAGDPESIYQNAGVTFAGDKQDYDVELEYSLVDATKVTIVDGLITAVADGAKIKVAFPEGYTSDYYVLGADNVTPGTLTFSNEYELVLGGENTLQDIETAETNGSENVKVTFAEGAISMKKQEWYAMVLPFKTSAKQLVDVLKTYVVVNTLSDKSTDQNFKFKLEMDEIPAGKPFIIKPNDAIDWSAITPAVAAVPYANVNEYNTDKGTDLTADEFAALTDDQKIKTPAIPAVPATFTEKTIVSEITPYGADGIVTIDGTYETTDILGVAGKKSAETANIIDRVWWLSDTDYEASVIANDWRKPKTNAHPLKPMEAYLIAADGWTTYSPVITVEDFDGQTTAIKTLNAEKINGLNVGEGWYNLNGVKLQGAPTQKGVYINNGKKVIIK